MKLTLKNRMLMAFDKMIEDAIKHGGNPDQIILTPGEAVDFLKEIRDNPASKERLVVKKNSVPMITLKIWREDHITVKDVNDVVRRWYAKEYVFHYKGVEIAIMKENKSKSKKRNPITPFNCWGDISDSQDYV